MLVRNPRLIDRATERLYAGGHRVSLIATEGPGSACVLARQCVEDGADAVIAAGGDGTINEAINGLAHSDTPLAVLPAGTANVLAVEIGLARSMEGAADLFGDLKPVRVSLGLLRATGIEPRYFLLMAGAGVDAYLVYNLDAEMKRRFGKLAYWGAGFTLVADRLEEFDVHSEGQTLRCTFALASRVRNYGGDIEIARNVSLLDDSFELITFEGSMAARYLLYLGAILTRQLARTEGVTVLRTRRAEFRAPEGNLIRVQIDGEAAGCLPASVEIVPHALTLLVPPAFLEREEQRLWTTSPIASLV